MAYPEYLENYVAIFIGGFLPSFVVLSFTFIVPPLLKRIVHEKETGVKELMKLMGLPAWMHWLTWFLSAISTVLVSIAIMIIIICVEWVPGTGRVMTFTDPGLLYLFLLLYAMSLIMFLFALSTFFESREF